MVTKQPPSPLTADVDPPTQPDIHIEVLDGPTDPAAPVPASGEQNTQIAEHPQRPAVPGTEFVHQIAPARVDKNGLGELDELDELDELPESPRTRLTRETARTPRERRIRRLTYGLVTTALLLIIGVCIYEIQRLSTPDEVPDATPAPEREAPTGPTTIQAVEPSASLPDELPDRGKKASRILAVEVEQVFADEHTEAFRLGDGLIAAGSITVVNLWATWCEPCKRELPGFRDLFASADWGDAVRFVPILLDSKDPVWASHHYAAIMPTDAPFLVDPLQSAVVAALRGPGLLTKDSGLPVTAVFDCRRHVRLLHLRELGVSDFEKLKVQLQQLQAELGTSFCTDPPRRPRVQPTPSAPEIKPQPALKPTGKVATSRCGNYLCEAGETATNCCDCLTCPDSKRCESPRSTPICVDKVSALKD